MYVCDLLVKNQNKIFYTIFKLSSFLAAGTEFVHILYFKYEQTFLSKKGGMVNSILKSHIKKS